MHTPWDQCSFLLTISLTRINILVWISRTKSIPHNTSPTKLKAIWNDCLSKFGKMTFSWVQAGQVEEFARWSMIQYVYTEIEAMKKGQQNQRAWYIENNQMEMESRWRVKLRSGLQIITKNSCPTNVYRQQPSAESVQQPLCLCEDFWERFFH